MYWTVICQDIEIDPLIPQKTLKTLRRKKKAESQVQFSSVEEEGETS